MVSTRSVKHKFSEGEKVLCYEPDPAKTKVLYNSKVLGISVKKDNNGKKVVHFLIHFQGWNSTWDRLVTEDFILKDTEENRRLQKELAEKAQLTSGGNLYRRGRKKRTLSRTGSDNERRGGGESDSEGETTGSNVHISVSPGIQAILELDNLLITKQNKLLKIPACPNAVEILEMYIKEFTISQVRLMCHRRGHLRPTAGKNAHITVYEIYSRANLCHEVADGLRVYLDFMTELALLYKPERAQFKEYIAKPRVFPLRNIKKEEDRKTEVKEGSEAKRNSPVKETERRKSLRSHTEPSNLPPVVTSTSPHSSQPAANSSEAKTVNSLSSNRGDASCTTNHDFTSILGRDGPPEVEHLVLRPMSNKEKDLIRRLVNRKLVPDTFLNQQYSEGNLLPPCLLYGATHLARALVKIPEIFPHAEHPEPRINLINEYLVGFSKFLEGHPEWFGEHIYCDNTYPDTTAGGS